VVDVEEATEGGDGADEDHVGEHDGGEAKGQAGFGFEINPLGAEEDQCQAQQSQSGEDDYQ